MLRLISAAKFSSKIISNPKQLLQSIPNGSTVVCGGFGLCGVPENIIRYVKEIGTRDLTIVSNNGGVGDWGLGILISNHQVKRMVSSYVGENGVFEKQYFNGEIELELIPQGTIAEKVRNGGAGIPAFYTPTGVGTLVQLGGFPIKYKLGGKQVEIVSQPREIREFKGRKYIMEESIVADYAFIKAWKADTAGNLIFNKSARNFNQDMVTAARTTIVEVEEIVEAGQLNPDHIHTPGIYVDYVFKGELFEKRFEKIVYNKAHNKVVTTGKQKNTQMRDKIIARAALEIKTGMYVNLGVGIPTLLPSFLPADVSITLESENGVLGYGDYPNPGEEDADLINAGKETITFKPGSSIFSSSQSFAMIRGGHVDATILGAMQVSRDGSIANWIIPGKIVKGMGGAMDLVASGSKVIVVMEHTAKGDHKLLEQCSLPLTGEKVVDILITEQAVFERRNGVMVLTEIAKETTLDQVRANTGFQIEVATNLGTF